MNYRRARVGGDTYFFTVSLAQREGRLLVDHIDILRNAVRYVKTRHPWEHLIRDDTDFARHVDYIPYNPVKHGYADAAAHRPYSSIHR